jgi:hypothetical protein
MNKRFVYISLLLLILLIIGTITFSQLPKTNIPEEVGNGIASSTPATTTPVENSQPPEKQTNYIVNQSYHNKTVHLKVGDEFLLALADDIDWKVTLSNQDVVEQLRTTEALQGTQGIFKAKKPGKVTLEAGGGKKCAAGEACILIYATFTTTIIVE